MIILDADAVMLINGFLDMILVFKVNKDKSSVKHYKRFYRLLDESIDCFNLIAHGALQRVLEYV